MPFDTYNVALSFKLVFRMINISKRINMNAAWPGNGTCNATLAKRYCKNVLVNWMPT